MTQAEALSLLGVTDVEEAQEVLQQKLFEHKHKLLQGAFSSPIIGISLRKIGQLMAIESVLSFNSDTDSSRKTSKVDLKLAPLDVWKSIQAEMSASKLAIMKSANAAQLNGEVLLYKMLAEHYEQWLSGVLSEFNFTLPDEPVPAKNVIDPMYLNAALEELYGSDSKHSKIDAKFEENHKELLLELKRVKDINAKFHLA